ncbi:sugar ABC transporter permease [Alginatibacterium sediminis]|uniref:Sugar ABC transporter permease n=1 Tax=Alginatibacterium sediminis TaxID=2164068 RepID=A0A420EB48_9ALTE|nr:sugar ABC transporter permease [Alginatibacterium sediminis]RKF17906.1 sugar ABC transporter permease [Alginatibacterium sediminis]
MDIASRKTVGKQQPTNAKGSLKRSDRRFAYAILVPAMTAFLIMVAYPFFDAMSMSFFQYTIYDLEPIFIGFDNFVAVLTDPYVLGSWLTTAIFVVGTTLLTMTLGLAWALLMYQDFKGRGVMRTLTLLPWILPSTVSAFVWAWMLNGKYGIVNVMLLGAGFIDSPIQFLSEDIGAMLAVILTRTWISIPLFMSFFLAGLQGMDYQQIEAARIDGAGNLRIVKRLILPHLKPVFLVTGALGMIGNLQQFDIIYALTGGGPVRATSVLSIEVFRQAFENWDLGMASAIGVLWVFTLMPIVIFYLRSLFKED